MDYELAWQTIVSELDSHWAPHTSDFVSKQSPVNKWPHYCGIIAANLIYFSVPQASGLLPDF